MFAFIQFWYLSFIRTLRHQETEGKWSLPSKWRKLYKGSELLVISGRNVRKLFQEACRKRHPINERKVGTGTGISIWCFLSRQKIMGRAHGQPWDRCLRPPIEGPGPTPEQSEAKIQETVWNVTVTSGSVLIAPGTAGESVLDKWVLESWAASWGPHGAGDPSCAVSP